LVATGPDTFGDRLVLGRSDDAIFTVTSTSARRLDGAQWTTIPLGGTILVASFAARSRNEVYFQITAQSRYYVSDGTTRRPFRHLSLLPTIVEQALALDSGLYVRSNNGNGLFGWWGTRPTGL
jgi:hypothetical protein